MTSEWHEVPLRELVGYISKGIAPSYAEEASESTIRVLNQKCNRNFRISYGDSRLHDTRKKKVPPERYVKPDDILINSTGAGTAGRIAQIEDVPSATTIDGHMVKRLLKKHKYPPEGMDDAVQTVMSQCEMWTDNVMTA